jgi:hypothetical protein
MSVAGLTAASCEDRLGRRIALCKHPIDSSHGCLFLSLPSEFYLPPTVLSMLQFCSWIILFVLTIILVHPIGRAFGILFFFSVGGGEEHPWGEKQ